MQVAIIERKLLWYSYWGVISGLVILGFVFIGLGLAEGPKGTGTGSIIPWGLGVSFYILFIGLSAGAFLISALVYAFGVTKYLPVGRLALLAAFLSLIIGLLSILLDLGHPERFWHIWTVFPQTSVIWWMIQVILFYIVLLVAELYFVMRADLIGLREKSQGIKRAMYSALSLKAQRRDEDSLKRDMKVTRILAIIGIPTAVLLHGGTGSIFAVMKAVPIWYSPLTPVMFLTSAMVSGAGLLIFVRAFFFRPQQGEVALLSSIGKLALLLIAVDWTMIMFEILVSSYGLIYEHLQVLWHRILGPDWWIFWVFQVGMGVVVPLIIILNKRTGKSRGWLGLAGLGIVLGIMGWRWNFVVPPLALPKIEGLAEAFVSARLTVSYVPNLGEWLSYVGLFSLWFLLFSVGKALLPIEEAAAGPVSQPTKSGVQVWGEAEEIS